MLLMGPSDHPMNPIQTLGAGATGVLSEMLCLKPLASLVWFDFGKDLRAQTIISLLAPFANLGSPDVFPTLVCWWILCFHKSTAHE